MRCLKRIWKGLAPRREDPPPPPRIAPSPALRKHLLFSGWVQGVGFRFEVMRLAEQLGLTGWVRNLPDGRVEAELQGEEGRIAYLVEAVGSIRRITVESVEEEAVPLVPGETDFDVRWE